jgi:hypothetical protein
MARILTEQFAAEPLIFSGFQMSATYEQEVSTARGVRRVAATATMNAE